MFPITTLQQLWLQNLHILVEAPQVVAQRLALFGQPYWHANTWTEYYGMYWEKVAAVQEVYATWWLFWCSPQQQSNLLDWRRPYRYQQWLNDSVHTANRSLQPVSRRVRANRKRLNKAK